MAVFSFKIITKPLFYLCQKYVIKIHGSEGVYLIRLVQRVWNCLLHVEIGHKCIFSIVILKGLLIQHLFQLAHPWA